MQLTPFKTVLNKRWAMDFGGRKKLTKSDDGWLTAIDKIYPRNSVGLISAKYRSDVKWCAQHGGIIHFFKFIRWESYKILLLTYDGLSGRSFLFRQNPWPTFCLNQPYFISYLTVHPMNCGIGSKSKVIALPYRPGNKKHQGIRNRHYIYPN